MLLRTLGGLALEGSSFSRPQPLLLLAYLALEGPKERRFLAELFWRESHDALNRLSSTLSKLRNAAPDAIASDASRVWTQLECDADQLATAVRTGRFEAAAELYRGAFLEGLSLDVGVELEEWIYATRERLAAACRTALLSLAEREADRARFDVAVAWAEKALRIAGGDEVEGDELERLARVLTAGGSPYAAALREEARGYGIDVEDTPEAAREHLRASPAAAPGPPRALLPVPATPLVGREDELRRLEEMLGDPACRLVTVTAPGGMGKTRLAVAAGERVAGAFPDGVAFVDCTPLQEPEQIAYAVAGALGVRLDERTPERAQLLAALRAKRMLLILDNLEHLVADTGLIRGILESAAGVTLLVTSRVRLGLQAEWLFDLGGLSLPGGAEPDDRSGAVALFVQTARRVRPDFVLDEATAAPVERLCRLVSGMPLAIELAAGWLPVLSPAEIADEVARNLDVLETRAADVPPRQRSVRAVLDGAWTMLQEAERDAAMALSVFRGHFDRAAAMAVAACDLRTLLRLVDASWVRHEGDRLVLHELARQYLEERLELSPEAETRVRDRHAEHFAERFDRLASDAAGARQARAFREIAEEMGNARAAWLHLCDRGRARDVVQRMLPALFRYFEVPLVTHEFTPLIHAAERALVDEGEAGARDLVPILVARASFFGDSVPVRANIVDALVLEERGALDRAWDAVRGAEEASALGLWGVQLAWLHAKARDADRGIARLEAMVPFLRASSDDRWTLAFALQCLGQVRTEVLRSDAQAPLSEALAAFRELGDRRQTGLTLRLIGLAHLRGQELSSARAALEEARATLLEASDLLAASRIDFDLAGVDFRLGRHEAAFARLQELCRTYERSGMRRHMVFVLSRESYEAVRYSTPEHALRTRERCLALARETGDMNSEIWSLWETGEIHRVAGDAEAARVWFERSRLAFERAGERNGLAFVWRGLGDLALAAADLDEAERCFRRSLEVQIELRHHWGAAYAYGGLARAACGLGRLGEAREHVLEGLHEAELAADPGLQLHVAASAARIAAAAGDANLAAELTALIARHPASWRETRSHAAPPEAHAPGGAGGSLVLERVRRRLLDAWTDVPRRATGA